MTEQPASPLESQIAQLERELAAKRAELGTDASVPYERSEVHAAVGEQIRQSVPGYQPQPQSPAAGSVPSWQDPALATDVQALVNTAFTVSVSEAIAQALKSGNPALIDALHDILADQFHQELINRQKIAPAP